jgi:hypothetical protein
MQVARFPDQILNLTIILVAKLVAVIVYAPIFSVAGIILAVIGATIGRVYLKAQMSVKRELSKAKAPVLGTIGSAIHGLGKTDEAPHYTSHSSLHSFNSGLRCP